MRDYSAGERLDDKAWFDRCCELIEQGVDPLAKCDGGTYVWDLLPPPANAPWEYSPVLLPVLMEKGFNPLVS